MVLVALVMTALELELELGMGVELELEEVVKTEEVVGTAATEVFTAGGGAIDEVVGAGGK